MPWICSILDFCNVRVKIENVLNDRFNAGVNTAWHYLPEIFFFMWFVSEQVEEVDGAKGAVLKIKLMGDAQGGMAVPDRSREGRESRKEFSHV